jgi:simple sugar transport system ATP-binding protein
MSTANREVLLELKNVSKRFGSMKALTDISFQLYSGEILGLLGDNGAGKSTLIKILSGYHQPTEGTIEFNGKSVELPSPTEALNIGISTVYQDLAMVDELSIARNFFLGHEPSSFGFLNRKKLNEAAVQAIREVGIYIRDANDPVKNLSGGERQAIAIARACYFGKKILILDEPTSALSLHETNRIFTLMREAKAKGLCVILITHNMTHAQEICDRFIVLRQGRLVGQVPVQTNKDELERMITDGKH